MKVIKPFSLDELDEVAAQERTGVIYHVFSDSRDEWFKTYKEAKKLFREWAAEYGTARLYIESETDENDDPLSGREYFEDCLDSFGDYPM